MEPFGQTAPLLFGIGEVDMSGNRELADWPVCGRNGLLVKGELVGPYPVYIDKLVDDGLGLSYAYEKHIMSR